MHCGQRQNEHLFEIVVFLPTLGVKTVFPLQPVDCEHDLWADQECEGDDKKVQWHSVKRIHVL